MVQSRSSLATTEKGHDCMAKAKRAAAGSAAIAQKLVNLSNKVGPTKAARLLGISRRQLYRYRQAEKTGRPLRELSARPSTVKKYERRLQSAAAEVMTAQSRAYIEDKPPPMKQSEAASILSNITGERWSTQRVTNVAQSWAKEDRVVAVPTEEPEFGEHDRSEEVLSFFERDNELISTAAYETKGVSFYKPGGENIPHELTHRYTFMTKAEAVEYVNRMNAQKVLFVVESYNKASDQTEYNVYLYYPDE